MAATAITANDQQQLPEHTQQPLCLLNSQSLSAVSSKISLFSQSFSPRRPRATRPGLLSRSSGADPMPLLCPCGRRRGRGGPSPLPPHQIGDAPPTTVPPLFLPVKSRSTWMSSAAHGKPCKELIRTQINKNTRMDMRQPMRKLRRETMETHTCHMEGEREKAVDQMPSSIVTPLTMIGFAFEQKLWNWHCCYSSL
nr:uncharacterized protein LOC127331211 isoform X3 [Lolium perenne]